LRLLFTGGINIRFRKKIGRQAPQTQTEGDGDGNTEEERALPGDAQTAQTHTEGGALGGGLQRHARVCRRARDRQSGQHTRVPGVRRRPGRQRATVHRCVHHHSHGHAAAGARERVQLFGL